MSTATTLFDRMSNRGHELVVHGSDQSTHLKTIIAIHSTALGPALGGTRFYPYHNEADALADVLRLAEGMTLKSAAAELDLGGGKAVIVGNPGSLSSATLFHAYASIVDALGGQYITAEDVGTSLENMATIREKTRWVAGLPQSSGGSGDPSPMTARGVLAAMKAVATHLWKSDSLGGSRIAIQGVGKVGSEVARLLADAGSEVFIADANAEVANRVANETGAQVVSVERVLRMKCDIVSPCALGGVLEPMSIANLHCAAVVGSANNQLVDDHVAELIRRAGVVYAPDFIVNAGGIINIADELQPDGYRSTRAGLAVDRIFDRVLGILEAADKDGATPLMHAKRMAEARLARAA